MSINKVILVGNVGNEIKISTLKSGNEVANFSLATTDSWKDKKTGEKKDKTEWHRVVVFSSGLAGIVKNYVRKGSKLYIEGSLQTRKWTDKDNNEKYVTEIVLQGYGCSLQLLDGKSSDTKNSTSTKTHSEEQEIKYFVDRNGGEVIDNKEFVEKSVDEIPF